MIIQCFVVHVAVLLNVSLLMYEAVCCFIIIIKHFLIFAVPAKTVPSKITRNGRLTFIIVLSTCKSSPLVLGPHPVFLKHLIRFPQKLTPSATWCFLPPASLQDFVNLKSQINCTSRTAGTHMMLWSGPVPEPVVCF